MVMLQRWSLNRGRMVMLEVITLMKGEWSYYKSGQFNGRNGHVTERSL